jgi:hypothetical protein
MSFKLRTVKEIACKECGTPVKVDADATAVTCWKCVALKMDPTIEFIALAPQPEKKCKK